MRERLAWSGGKPKDKAADTRRPGEEQMPLWDLTFREFALPWVNFIMIDDLLQGKAPVRRRGSAAVC
jgi:hypothetical protein